MSNRADADAITISNPELLMYVYDYCLMSALMAINTFVVCISLHNDQ